MREGSLKQVRSACLKLLNTILKDYNDIWSEKSDLFYLKIIYERIDRPFDCNRID